MPAETITGIVEGSADFELLGQALAAFELDDDLDDLSGDFTVFAPTDAAFVQLAQDLGDVGDDETGSRDYLLANVDAAVLEQVLLYQVSTGAKDAIAVSDLEEIDTLAGEVISTDLPVLVDLEPDIADPSLVATDIAATNSIVHVIDRILLPLDLPGNDAPSIDDLTITRERGATVIEDGLGSSITRGGRPMLQLDEDKFAS
ncbi:fasciclin domain-containing protein [Limibaculum sp. M0105]|uniref:Fasciclin domain-containing protein n=1 Tax=Thermohalobaculum xanthum TaxID=2753746 RepID=A0A8J7SIF9_9RHOB|nr:fasciclin domain-containing protein [Thermohalobaculum xanthum]MBK0400310.1 fasciclin domain-containing protein [Thermohalobaculum xanthum]